MYMRFCDFLDSVLNICFACDLAYSMSTVSFLPESIDSDSIRPSDTRHSSVRSGIFYNLYTTDQTVVLK